MAGNNKKKENTFFKSNKNLHKIKKKHNQENIWHRLQKKKKTIKIQPNYTM